MTFTLHLRPAAPVAVLLAALGLAVVAPTHAQTVLTGHHDGNKAQPGGPYGDGYDAAAGSYVVPADTSAGPSATFNSNDGNGFSGDGSTLTVDGGQFEDNGGVGIGASTVIVNGGTLSGNLDGIYAGRDGTVTVTGGTISHNTAGILSQGATVGVSGGDFLGNNEGIGAYGGLLTVSGGTFSGGTFGVSGNADATVLVTGGVFENTLYGGVGVFNAALTLMGGQFSGNTYYDLNAAGGSMDVYGRFDGLQPGDTLTLPSSPSGATGAFTGTLENETAQHTFTYYNSATITLHDVAPAPEPSQTAALGLGALGLASMAVKACRRKPSA